MTQSSHSQQYAYLINRAGHAAIIAASLLIIVKLIAWFMTGSSSILAALTDSLMDVTTSVINLFAIKIALQPADKEHRFGHGKAESLAGLAQAAFISGSSIFLMINGVSALVNNQPIHASNVGISVMVFSLLVTLALVLFQSYVVRKTNSMAIKADALHYRTDIMLNGSVLLAIILASYGWHWADGVFAIGVSLFILYGAWEIGIQSIDALMDKQLPQEDQELIIKRAYSVKGVRGVHDLRTRYSGYIKFIQLHLELDDEQTLFDAHQKADDLELILETDFPGADILIHLDPISVVPERNSIDHIQADSSTK
ncbi:cation diffusion facilitator family transporter [Psychromonas sp. 14N.309.X.WAT.B.A12]|uniref:cation diffusion facilitator family transporter n=1 Tax=unclassified Psychromonas TaxID=2614957 RepID=UPI0025AFE7DA|nr:cation diffusion facilitator family transporter [Psychromonas sp. 14N.309.X.WAT.B.A12]MDN2664694.1 cation diffusion facilitator family transporter [Psychromonas sp. 14N.309.X.WAT.B.A12]